MAMQKEWFKFEERIKEGSINSRWKKVLLTYQVTPHPTKGLTPVELLLKNNLAQNWNQTINFVKIIIIKYYILNIKLFTCLTHPVFLTL